MTQLIVALDGPEPFKTMIELNSGAHGVWFKVGPLTLTWPDDVGTIEELLRRHRETLDLNVFHDAKLADHGPYVCGEFAKRLAEKGYAALSTSTDEATEAAVRGAEGSPLRVWRHVAPTSQRPRIDVVRGAVANACGQGVHGVILPAHFAEEVRESWIGFDIVCPGVRLDSDDGDGHWGPVPAELVAKAGVTHAVVGRPICRSKDRVAAARRYQVALR